MSTVKDIENYLQINFGWINKQKLKKGDLLSILEIVRNTPHIYLRDEKQDTDR